MPKLRAPKLRPPARRPKLSGTPSDSSRRPAHLHRPRVPSRGSDVVGLEIGATQMIAALAHLADGVVLADRIVTRPLPAGLVHDGVVVEAEALGRELKEFFAEHRLPKRVRIGLATPRTILRVIDLPPLEEADIRAALLVQAQDRIPMPLEKAVLDYQSVGVVDTPEGRRLRVVVVVTERAGVETLLQATGQAGLRADGIDLSIFAAMRSVTGAHPEVGPTLYAQLGDLVNIAITDGGVCRFTRQAPQGLGLVLERLAELNGSSVEEAHGLLRAVVADGSAAGAGELGSVVSRVAFELGSELRAAAEFYAGQFGSAPVSRGLVCGPLAPLPGFIAALADASGLDLHGGEVTAANASVLTDVDPRVVPVAVGLAVAEVTS